MKLKHESFLKFIGKSLHDSIPLAPNKIDFTISVHTRGDYQEIELIVSNEIYRDYRYMWE